MVGAAVSRLTCCGGPQHAKRDCTWRFHVTGPIVLGSCLKQLWLTDVEVLSDENEGLAGVALYAEHAGKYHEACVPRNEGT